MDDDLDDWKNLEKHSVSFPDNPVAQVLGEAAKKSSPITIRYYGGSQPGSSRSITPLDLFNVGRGDAEYVSAFCHRCQENRTFRIDLIEINGANELEYGGYLARRKSYGRGRRYDHTSDAGREAAKRHIEEARQFTKEMGGTDTDVKAYFFSLADGELDTILTAYGQQYGASKEEYARQTFPRWRRGITNMSGLVAKRLFDFLPLKMPLKKKFELAENVWRHFGSRSHHAYVVGPSASVGAVADQVAARLDQVITYYSVPDNVQNRFKWLSAGDVQLQEKLLNHFRQMEKALAIKKVNLELPVLQRQASDHGAATHRAKSVVKIHRHEIELWVDSNLDNDIREGKPAFAFDADKNHFGWIWWAIGITGLILFFLN